MYGIRVNRPTSGFGAWGALHISPSNNTDTIAVGIGIYFAPHAKYPKGEGARLPKSPE